ncbi:class A beta-lactamase-related serine hydrolase [Dankookia rubra]|uniref:Class A beta-lactamase-related serine hydrolase n=1 Tax=Dankookia rubra TaxID=1442381 RepID=A0A4R5QLI6_9PROT|nr:serine hydrolase domain-containing protein [Dankookia rubra]TDH63651.1 class A beta-lactamase-related serine hydrolase [Dankookia rubra]
MLERRAAFAAAAGLATASLIRPAAAATDSGPLARATRPEDAGLSRDRLGRVTAWLQSEVDAGRIPGAVVAIGRGGKLALHEPVGFRDREARAPMPADAIFRIASMTKPFASLALMMLAEEGKVMLWHPVSRYLPEFKGQKVGLEGAPVEREATLQDLLRHTAGLTYGALPGPGPAPHPVQSAYVAAKVADRSLTSAEFTARLAAQPLMFQPGTTWEYSHATDVVGRIVEVVAGQDLDAFIRARISAPLGLADTGFWAPPEAANRVARAQVDPVTNARQAIPDALEKPRMFSGGGGMVSTAMDYARFCQMLLNGGRLGEAQLASRSTIQLMSANHLPEGTQYGPGLLVRFGGLAPAPVTGYGFGLGFAVRTAQGRSPVPGNVGDYFWGGAYGTYFWIDPKEELYAVLMLQGPSDRIQYRYAMRQLVYQALT